MKSFAALYETLDQTTSTNAKVAAMVSYLQAADPADAAWAVYFLSGKRIKRLLGSSVLKQWLKEEVSLPEWLVDDCPAAEKENSVRSLLCKADSGLAAWRLRSQSPE